MLPVDCEAFRPPNFTLLFIPVRLGEPRSPDGRRREHSRPDNLIFSIHARRGLPVRHGDFETTVGRRREPPSQTILPFQVLSSARLTRPTRRLLKPPSDAGESLPARQSYLSSPSARLTCPTRRLLRASQPNKLTLAICSHHNIEPRRTLHTRPFRQS